MQNLVEPLGRIERRRRRNREALVAAGYEVISTKGIDAATMGEIAEMADVGSGTVYNYFPSKDDLVVVVMEEVMHRMTERIGHVTKDWHDPAQLYAFGMRVMMRAMIEDHRWRGLCRRPEVIAGAIFRVIGPLAMRDLANAKEAGRFEFVDADLVWRMTTYGMIAFGRAVQDDENEADLLNEAIVALLGLAGVTPANARRILDRAWPDLPKE